MRDPIKGGSEKPLLEKRKKLTESGYPELAKQAKEYWNADQAVKTMDKLRNIYKKYE